MGLGQKSVCKAPESSVVKGLLYAGIKRDHVSWPEVGTQFTAQSRDHRFGHKGVLAVRLPYFEVFPNQPNALEQRGQS